MKDDPNQSSFGQITEPFNNNRLEFMAMLLDNVSDAVISFDKEKKITFWNKGAEKIYGWSSSEAIGKNSAQLLRSEADESLRNKRLKDAERNGELIVEAVHYTRENKRIVVESRVIPLKDHLGEIIGYTAVNCDITRRKKAEEDLSDSENRYLSLFNNKTNGIAHCRTITDEEGIPIDYEIIRVNEAYTQITGIKKKDIEGKTARAVFPGIEHFSFDYIGNYGKVALEGSELNFEVFFEALNQWLSIYVYRPKYGEFTAIFTDITERKKTEEALRIREAQLDAFFANSPVILNLVDDKFCYINTDQLTPAYYGLSRESIKGKCVPELSRDFMEQTGKVMQHIIETGEPILNAQLQAPVPGKGNEMASWSTSMFRVPLGVGKWGVGTISIEMTNVKRAEAKLQESEERFRTLADNISQLAWMTDETGWIFWYNKRWFEYTGTTLEEMQGWGWQKVHHPDHIERVMGKWTIALEKGEAWEDTFPLKSKDGQFRWFLSRALPVKDENGKVIRWFGTNTDITERKEFEEALKASEAKLLEAQKLAHVGSFSYEILTGIVEWTEEIFNLYGVDPKKGVPSFDEITAMWHPEDLPWVTKAIEEGMKNKTVINFECRLLLPDNKVKFMNYIARGVYDSNGKPLKRIGTAADITERKLYELELIKTLENLKRSNNELEQFAYVSSHDLQEPLRMVSMYTRMLEIQLKDSLDEKTKQYMFFVTDGAKRMYNLIQDLLAYSRVTSREEAFMPTDLNGVMAEVLRDLQVAISDHNAEILYEKLPSIKADPSQIKLVFQNLIQNAIKFRGKDKPLVEISAERRAKEWLFCIKDNGIGIDPECHEKIFVIFQRLHEKELYPGTGIGLSICRKIVERHGGRIWVESEEGKGSRFFVTIPVY